MRHITAYIDPGPLSRSRSDCLKDTLIDRPFFYHHHYCHPLHTATADDDYCRPTRRTAHTHTHIRPFISFHSIPFHCLMFFTLLPLPTSTSCSSCPSSSSSFRGMELECAWAAARASVVSCRIVCLLETT